MINYVLFQNRNEGSKVYGKWYARAVHHLMEFNEFVAHMAAHHCVYSEGTIRGVLIEMEECLREMLLEGKSVRFDELGIFSLGIDNATGGATTASDFNVGRNISGIHMNLFLGKRFRARELYQDATFVEQRLYDVDSSKPDGGGGGSATVDGSGSNSSSGGGLPDEGD